MVRDVERFARVANDLEITMVRFPAKQAAAFGFTQCQGKRHHRAEREQAEGSDDSHAKSTSTIAVYFRPS